jgi:lipopolysaccharide/colanic/teichoic acid biosynthesis glycosyltransferase
MNDRTNLSEVTDNCLKRTFDILVAAVALLLISPLLAYLALRIKLDSRGPLLYRGERVGLRGQKFRICKFRTMIVDADRVGGSSTAADDPRITRIGAALRRYKLDELPQLINVLAGDMSLVGPRPQVAWAVALYNEQEQKLLNVRPGVTDYASIRFRNEAEILRGSANPDKTYLELIAPEKIRLGLEYVDHHSLWTDLRILTTTFFCIFTQPNPQHEMSRAE